MNMFFRQFPLSRSFSTFESRSCFDSRFTFWRWCDSFSIGYRCSLSNHKRCSAIWIETSQSVTIKALAASLGPFERAKEKGEDGRRAGSLTHGPPECQCKAGLEPHGVLDSQSLAFEEILNMKRFFLLHSDSRSFSLNTLMGNISYGAAGRDWRSESWRLSRTQSFPESWSYYVLHRPWRMNQWINFIL